MPDNVVFDSAALGQLLESEQGPVARELTRRVIRVESAAIRGCPVDTGRLRSSITHEIAADHRGLVGRVGTDVEYAPYVEYGTSRSPAQPYLRPALGAAQ
jgi:HK97 gp10 family phage protein